MQFGLFQPLQKKPEIHLKNHQCSFRDPEVLLPHLEEFLDNINAKIPNPPEGATYEVVNTEETFEEIVQQLNTASWISFDTETEGLAKRRHRIIGYCISYRRDGGAPEMMYDDLRNIYIPVRYRTGEACLDPVYVREKLRPIVEDPSKVWLMWNGNYDEHMSANETLYFGGVVFEGIIPRRLLHPTRSSKLKDVASELFDPMANVMQDVIALYIEKLCKLNKWPAPRKKKKSPVGRSYFEYVPISLIGHYGPRDTHYTWACAGESLRRIQVYPGLMSVHETEQKFRKVIWEMERLGLYVNQETRQSSEDKIKVLMEEIEEKAFDLAGRNFNLGSTDQIIEVFRCKSIPLTKSTKNTKKLPKHQQRPCTDAKVMSRLVHKGYELPALILRWRQLRDCRNKSLKYMSEYVDMDGCIHASFWQMGTESARCVSSGPNVQNFPNHGEQKELVRGCFEIHPEYKEHYTWLFADLSQIELRVLAHISQDPVLLKAYREGRDVHTETAIRIFGQEAWDAGDSEARYEMRSAGKATNFGIIYQIGPDGLSDALFKVGIVKSRAECKEFIRVFKEAFPTVMKWIEDTILKAKREGILTNLFGRTRDFSEVKYLKGAAQKAMERELVNWVIQSSAADLFKKGIVWLNEKRIEMGWQEGWKWLNNIHDELQLYIRDEWLGPAIAWIKFCFEEVLSKHLSVPILLDVETSKSTWLAKKEYKRAA